MRDPAPGVGQRPAQRGGGGRAVPQLEDRRALKPLGSARPWRRLREARQEPGGDRHGPGGRGRDAGGGGLLRDERSQSPPRGRPAVDELRLSTSPSCPRRKGCSWSPPWARLTAASPGCSASTSARTTIWTLEAVHRLTSFPGRDAIDQADRAAWKAGLLRRYRRLRPRDHRRQGDLHPAASARRGGGRRPRQRRLRHPGRQADRRAHRPLRPRPRLERRRPWRMPRGGQGLGLGSLTPKNLRICAPKPQFLAMGRPEPPQCPKNPIDGPRA